MRKQAEKRVLDNTSPTHALSGLYSAALPESSNKAMPNQRLNCPIASRDRMGAVNPLVPLLLLFAASAFGQTPVEFFEAKVRPVLAGNCYACHGEDQQLSGLRVDGREALLAGGKRGPAIVPGKPQQSLLIKAIRHENLQMPPGGKLRDAQIEAIERWIQDGATWPIAKGAPARARTSHWAFQPVKPLPPPPGTGSEIDRFLLAELRKKRLSLAPPADRTTLARRLSFVLTGLPPTPEQVRDFVADKAPGPERLVDRLLDSPHFGEHWARHWMDLVRYGETRGYEWNYEIAGAWRYRDYLIRAFNSDVPYDQFVREHIAGDLLENPRINGTEGINESKIGTAFYRLGEAGHDDCIQFRELSTDVIDNQIDTLSKTFQGLTVSCARCHNHKLDPIPTADYYGTYGILNSSRPVVHTLDTPEVHADSKAKLRELKARIKQEVTALWLKAVDQLQPKTAKVEMESPAYPWIEMSKVEAAAFPSKWRELADRYRREASERSVFNNTNFKPFGDFRKGFDDWFADGVALNEGSFASGDFAIVPDGDSVISAIYPAGVFTNVLSGKFNASLRSPNLPKDKKFISVRLMGGRLGARRTIIDNCAIGENYKVLDSRQLKWLKLDTFSKEPRLPVFFEMVTKSDNPRIPDRPGVLKDYKDEEIEKEARSYFGIVRAVVHDVDSAPKEDLGHMLRLFQFEPANQDELRGVYRLAMRQALEEWAAGASTDEDVLWLNWLAVENPLKTDSSPELKELIAAYRDVDQAIAAPRVVEGLADQGPGFDTPILIAGDAKSFGAVTPRHFLTLLGNTRFDTVQSGRRELAELLASPANPLTARVMVNRIWHHLFGRGLVKTTDNFGTIGDQPSHPELLDYLATRFVADGWSIKTLIRRIVLTQAFQQSGDVSAKTIEADPDNMLLHHYPLRRLPAESVRDAILQTSGRLKTSVYGAGVHPARQEAKDYRRLFSGPLDGEGRRSIYTKITRMEGPKFLEIFDYPPPLSTRGERDVTNVPAQALALLNDPFVLQQAGVWASGLIAKGHQHPEQRITEMFQRALGRSPDAAELDRFRGLALELSSLHGVARESIMSSEAVWKDVAHAIFNLKEFLYVR